MSWIQKIKRWILTKKFIFEEEITPVAKSITQQENERDAQTRKRVAAAFKAQEKQMQARAMKAHDATCKDPLTCKKKVCFVWVSDQIINRSVVDQKEKREVYLKEYNSDRVRCRCVWPMICKCLNGPTLLDEFQKEINEHFFERRLKAEKGLLELDIMREKNKNGEKMDIKKLQKIIDTLKELKHK